jgi:hypothetical protein
MENDMDNTISLDALKLAIDLLNEENAQLKCVLFRTSNVLGDFLVYQRHEN